MMIKYTPGQWKFVCWPIPLGENCSDWYLVGSAERAVGFIRHKSDARLITAAPEMYELLKSVTEYQTDRVWDVQYYARQLLARIDGGANEQHSR